MHQYEFFGFKVEINENLTKDWYARSNAWGCECDHCRNFLILAKKKQLPVSVMEILNKLEIPAEKATYVCELYPVEDGYLYQFSYRIVGNILSERVAAVPRLSWGEGYCCHEPYPYGAPHFPNPHFDLEFWVTLPWVLKENPNG